MSTENILEILARRNTETIKRESILDALRQDSETIADGWRQLGLYFTGGGTDISGDFARVGQGGRVVGR